MALAVDVPETLNLYPSAIVEWLSVSKLKLNPVKMEIMLVGQPEILKDMVQLTLANC